MKYEDERYIPYGVNSMREILDAVEAGRNVYLKRESSDLAWSIYPLSSIDYTYEDEMFSNGFVVEFMSPGSPAKWTFTTKVSEMDYMPDASFYSGSAT